MTKAAAMQSFWASFGIPAYEENSVPQNATFPRLTYQLVTDSFGSPVSMTASLWYKTTSNVQINAKAEEISRSIGRSGKALECDGGGIIIFRGKPFAQFAPGDPEDQTIKRKIINISAEFVTAD